MKAKSAIFWRWLFSRSLWQSFLYYSYVTLTTMGYGDILPVTMLARSAAISEAVIGVMYTAIIVSHLVALYISHNDEESHKS